VDILKFLTTFAHASCRYSNPYSGSFFDKFEVSTLSAPGTRDRAVAYNSTYPLTAPGIHLGSMLRIKNIFSPKKSKKKSGVFDSRYSKVMRKNSNSFF
jgi:hypothetical protein